jgi:hypothetical protein
MSNRSQFSLEVAQMGKVWVASLSLFGISVIGVTQAAAIEAVMEAFKTHALAGDPTDYSVEPCDGCS